MSWVDAVTPIASVIVGAGAALSGQWLTERRQGRAKQRADWAAFQRQTLIDLQDVLLQIYGIHGHDAYNQSIGREQTDAEEQALGEKLTMLHGKARALVSRMDGRELAEQTIRIMQLLGTDQIGEPDSTGANAFLDLVGELGQEIRRWNLTG